MHAVQRAQATPTGRELCLRQRGQLRRPVRPQRRRRRHRSSHRTVSYNPHRHERKHPIRRRPKRPLPRQLPPPEQQIAADPMPPRHHRYRHTRRQLSVTIRSFSSTLHRRRRSTPVITSIRS
jgi:hypothetical protein